MTYHRLSLNLQATLGHFVLKCMRELPVNLKRRIAKIKSLPFTVHSMKGFLDSGEIAVCKEQEQKPLLNLCDLQVLRQYCMINSHHTMMTKVSQVHKYLGKTFLLNTVCQCISQCNLKALLRRKPHVSSLQKRCHVLLR